MRACAQQAATLLFDVVHGTIENKRLNNGISSIWYLHKELSYTLLNLFIPFNDYV